MVCKNSNTPFERKLLQLLGIMFGSRKKFKERKKNVKNIFFIYIFYLIIENMKD